MKVEKRCTTAYPRNGLFYSFASWQSGLLHLPSPPTPLPASVFCLSSFRTDRSRGHKKREREILSGAGLEKPFSFCLPWDERERHTHTHGQQGRRKKKSDRRAGGRGSERGEAKGKLNWFFGPLLLRRRLYRIGRGRKRDTMSSAEGLVPITREYLSAYYDKYPLDPVTPDAER